jgi:hypothetical protein
MTREPLLIRPVDSDKVRAVISAGVANAVNDASASLRNIREWCDMAPSMVCSHGAVGPYDCERCEAIQDCAAAVRALLPPLGEVTK